jgi:6-phosphogluconolactonase
VKPDIVHSNDFAADAAQIVIEEAGAAIAERGMFRLGLCGGGTPKAVHAELVKHAVAVDWRHVQITFGDERCVPPEDAQSNYRMARETLLDPLTIPPANVFRMRGELPPTDAAREYEDKLAHVAARFGERRYAHDLLLLGMGGDGHTASLFPGTAALGETERSVVENHVPQPDTWRVTFTYPLINAARRVLFLVNDPGKAAVVDDVLAGRGGHPASGVRPAGSLTWLLGF